jgi:hypothetical protein
VSSTHTRAIRSNIQRKRLIFTLTTGRSGTGYLAEMLSCLPYVDSCHEPEPRFSEVMRSVQKDKRIAVKFWMNKKLPEIASKKAPIYIETSHLFCKGFIEPLLDMGVVPDLIILSRPDRDVAKSMLRLDTIPGRTEKGLRYYLSPEDPGVLPLPNWQSLHDYQLCYWYCLEIKRRGIYYEHILREKNAHIAKISLDDIRSLRGFSCMVRQLNLPRPGPLAWMRYFLNRRKKINVKTTDNDLPHMSVNFHNLEKEISDVINKLNVPESAGIRA